MCVFDPENLQLNSDNNDYVNLFPFDYKLGRCKYCGTEKWKKCKATKTLNFYVTCN